MQTLRKRDCLLQMNLNTSSYQNIQKKFIYQKNEQIIIKDNSLTKEDICYYLKQDYPIELRKKLYFLYF